MKSKLKGVLGIALTLVLLASLTVGLSVPAGADPGTLKFSKQDLPKVENWGIAGSEGDYWATPGTNVGPITISPDGDLLASLLVGRVYELMKSTDGGYSWKMMDGFSAVADGTPIVDIVTSPEYADDESLFVATEAFVYQSVDGGETFAAMPALWVAAEDITDLDVAMDERGRLTIMVGTSDGAGNGDVYIYGSKTLAWVAQGITGIASNLAPCAVDVLAVGFSPFFADDELISAVVTIANDGTGAPLTQVRVAVTPSTKAGTAALWGATYGTARVRDADDTDFVSASARMAFPDDFDAAGIDNNICFLALSAGVTGSGYGGTERGDVYKVTLKEATFSSAVDLNVRGEISTLLPTATNIVSIDVAGDAADASILAGTNYISIASTPCYFLVYRSNDAGETWKPSGTKSPTGANGLESATAWTQVLMSPDFLSNGIAYAGTCGTGTSGFSRSKDGGATWNQISLIDYGNGVNGYTVKFLAAAGYNKADTLHVVTWEVGGNNGAVWQTTNAGQNWERIWSYANPGVGTTIDEVWRVGEETIFAVDKANFNIWRSSDMGATWPKKITTKKPAGEAFTDVRFVSETELYTGFSKGSFYWSTNSGTTWDKPEENPMKNVIVLIKVKGDNILISAVNGVYFSSDGGETVERVGAVGEPAAGVCLALWDLGFADNNIIYATIAGVANAGVWRAEVDFADPGESEWERIDDNQDLPPAGAYDYSTVVATSPALALPMKGVLYITDGAPVVTGDVDGGLWRSTNPTADVDSAHPPYFEKENKGLDAGDSIGLLDADVFPTVLFCKNSAAGIPYWEQVVIFTDTLDSGVTLADPADAETGVGLIPEGGVSPAVSVAWEEMAGATKYQYQLAYDEEFKSVAISDFTESQVSKTLNLKPNKTYYWRVRVADEDIFDNLVGAPLISPWAEVWKFKTAIGAVKARPELEAPEAGDTDVYLTPTFEWSGIEWAEKYEFELGTDPGTTARGYFVDVIVGKTGAAALVSTAWKCDIELDYNTRYYWHVKAIGVDTETPWSDTGTFTTMAEPVPPPEPTPPVEIPPAPAPITPGWIWAIVVIGAILVIAVIVLIVTTRRTP